MEPVIYGDGEQTRDFVYIQDVVEANMLALNTKSAAGEVFNIGSGYRTTVNQVAQTIKNSLNRNDIKNVYADPRPGEVKHAYADINKARMMLNYAPRFSFEQGIEDLVAWYKTQLPLTSVKDS